MLANEDLNWHVKTFQLLKASRGEEPKSHRDATCRCSWQWHKCPSPGAMHACEGFFRGLQFPPAYHPQPLSFSKEAPDTVDQRQAISAVVHLSFCENNKVIDLSHSASGYFVNAVIATGTMSDWVCCCCCFVVTSFQTINTKQTLRLFGRLPLGHCEQRAPVEFAEAEVLILPSPWIPLLTSEMETRGNNT